jgi:iron complex outermembrane receptor protein
MNLRSISVFTLILAFFATSINAQVLEEVVVTAQKREQQLQDVGISVTAFSGDQLRALGFNDTTQIDEQVPGLMVTDYGSGTTTIFTSQLDFADIHEPPVAVYSDGGYNPFVAGVGFSFFDLDRIEVLRGPQGTLFGRNATGGVVHLISAGPTREFEGYGEATGGEYGQHRFEGAVSGPLGETLSGRLSGAYHKNSGYLKDLSNPGDKHQEIENFSGRAQLLWEPNEDLSIHVRGTVGFDDVNSGQLYVLSPVVPDPVTGKFIDPPSTAAFDDYCTSLGFGPVGAGVGDCFGTPADGDNRTAFNGGSQGFFKRDHYTVNGEINWTVGDFDITNIIYWQDLKKRFLEDTTSASIPAPLFDFFQDMDANSFSEEFRVAWNGVENLQLTVGAYYLNIESDMHTGVAPLFFGFDLDNTIRQETDTWAAFVQAEYVLNEQFTVIGGFRWTEDDKTMRFRPTCPGVGALIGVPAVGSACGPIFGPGAAQSNDLDVERSEGNWSGVFEIDWTPNEDWLLYAKYSRGNKAGGFNGGPASTYRVGAVEFAGEVLKSYEGGFKATLFGGTTRVNTSIYHYDYNNFQSFNAAGVDIFVANVDAENTGAEIEIVTNPWEGWEFLFGVGIQDAMQKDFNFGGFIEDTPLPNAPDIMLNGLARYEFAGFMEGRMAAQLDFNYVDSRSLNAAGHPALFDGSYTVVNAKLGWTSADDRWDAEIWVKNLGDVEYQPTAFEFSGFQGSSIDVYGPPRWVGGTVRYRFGG